VVQFSVLGFEIIFLVLAGDKIEKKRLQKKIGAINWLIINWLIARMMIMSSWYTSIL
jgi:uncharacterized membrane protein YwaF